MKNKLLYSYFLMVSFLSSMIYGGSPFGGPSLSIGSASNNPFGGSNLSTGSTSNNPFGGPPLSAPAITLPKAPTAQAIAGATTLQQQQATTQKAESLQVQNVIGTEQAITIIGSQKSSVEQKGVALLTNHTDITVSANDLQQNPVTAGAQQVTFMNKKKPPLALQYLAQKGTMSFTAIHNKAQPFIPDNGITADATLNQLYTNFMNGLQSDPGFIPFFRKLHIVALHEIYNYLMGIYAGLNITHIDNIQTYITTESLYGLNTKTLIINHLINLIEAQLNQAIQALFPTMPQQTASHSGMSAIELDESSKLDLFIIDIEQVVLATFKKAGINPYQWNTVFQELKNPDYQNFFTKIDQQSLGAALNKINYFYSTSMDLSSMPGSSKSSYQTTIQTVYQQAPQTTYFNGSVPSGTVWQKEINNITGSQPGLTPGQLPCSVSLIKQLSQNEKMALIDALDILVAHCSSIQHQDDTAAVITLLQGSDSNASLTYGQYTVLLNTVKPLALDGPIVTFMDSIKKIQPFLISGQNQVLNLTDIQVLQEILGFACSLFENTITTNIATSLHSLRTKLHNKFDLLTAQQKKIYQQYGGFTITEKALIQAMATQLLDSQINNTQLTQDQQQLLSQGFIFLAQQQGDTFSLSDRSLFTEIAQQITTNQQFSVAQQKAFITGLHYFKTLTINKEDILTESKAETDIYALFNQSQVDAVTGNFEKAGSAQAKTEYINNLSLSDTLILLVAFQLSGQILESRYAQHVQSAQTINMLLAAQKQIKKIMYQQISSKEYSNYVQLYQDLETATQSGSFDSARLSFDQRKDLYNLVALFVAPATNFTDEALNLAKTTGGILQLISDVYTKDPLIAPLLSLVNTTNQPVISSIYKKLHSYNFTYSDLTRTEKAVLLPLITAYQKALEANPAAAITKVPSSQTQTQSLKNPTHPLSIPNELILNEVVTILHACTHAQKIQDSLKTTLGQYLNFFAPYTATLQAGAGQAVGATSDDAYQGLTQFSNYAQSISQSLQTVKIDQINPPLFFYNAQTLRLINLLPFLAKSVEGTMSAPLPTLAINAAMSTTPTAANTEKNNLIVSAGGNQVTVPSLTLTTQGVTYSPRFFFKDKNGNPFANGSSGGQVGLPQWIQKEAAIPGSSESYFYIPAFDTKGLRIKPVGQEGLYMNIPMAHENAIKKGSAVIRLYEQKIVPQPEWLNSEAGVITMTRVCLGDFASALTLQEPVFDPCLELIFRQALATLPALPSGLPAGATIDVSTETTKKLSQSCQLSLIEKHLDAKARAQAEQTMNTESV